MLKLVLCSFFITSLFGAKLLNCPIGDIQFEKVLGLRPSDENHPLLLYRGDDNVPVTSECIAKCHANNECRSFVLYFNTSTCFWYRSSIEGIQESNSIPDNSLAWFVKICLGVKNCSILWAFERIPGAILIGNDTKELSGDITRLECERHCLSEKTFSCRSAKFRIKQSNYGPNGETVGICSLSDADRHLLPNSYRVSSYDEEYLENQCSKNYWNGDQTTTKIKYPKNAFCAYEEYTDVILKHTDLLYEKKTKFDCEQLCENLTSFNCRGYTLVPSKTYYTCLLHSEDSKVHGPGLLKEIKNANYFERARCLNVSVSCTDTHMTVKYIPEINFLGRIYMQGFSDHPECFAKGGGWHPVNLKLPLQSSQCGISEAMGPINRTLLSGTMVLQYNNFIQTQGDRLIKVGCIYGNQSKILVGTGVTITAHSSNTGSTLLNNSTISGSPLVQMRIIDLHTKEEVTDTQIGQELQLVIEIKPAKGSHDIWAGHLIAMTENSDESIFLLDDRGCPTDLSIFPALQKIENNSTKKLVANFQAFKFSSSSVVRFSVIVQFCPEICPIVDCGNNIRSHGRRKRSITSPELETVNGTKIININRTQFEDTNSFSGYKTPLEFIMIVRNSKISPDKLVVGENNRILVAGYDYSTNEICLDYSLFVGLIIAWILIQVIFIISSALLIRRYKRYYKHKATRQSLEELHKNFGIGFSNLENRRVRWADDE